MPGDPQQPAPPRRPDVVPNPVRPPTPQEEPKPDAPPGIPAPGPDVVTDPEPEEIPATFPPEAPPDFFGDYVQYGLSNPHPKRAAGERCRDE